MRCLHRASSLPRLISKSAAVDVLVQCICRRHAGLVLGRRCDHAPWLAARRKHLRNRHRGQHGARLHRHHCRVAGSRSLPWPRLRSRDTGKHRDAGKAGHGQAAGLRLFGTPDRQPDRRDLRFSRVARIAVSAWRALVLCGRRCSRALHDPPVRTAAAQSTPVRRSLPRSSVFAGGWHSQSGDRRIAALALASMPFSAMQVALNTCFVTFGVRELGLTYVEAGMALACAQAGGLAGRLGWGFAAMRLDASRMILIIIGLGMAFCALLLGTSGASLGRAGQFAIATVFGLTASGWNGVFLSEVARLAPQDRIAETTGAVLTASYAGLLAAPALVSAIDAVAGLGPAFVTLGCLAFGGTAGPRAGKQMTKPELDARQIAIACQCGTDERDRDRPRCARSHRGCQEPERRRHDRYRRRHSERCGGGRSSRAVWRSHAARRRSCGHQGQYLGRWLARDPGLAAVRGLHRTARRHRSRAAADRRRGHRRHRRHTRICLQGRHDVAVVWSDATSAQHQPDAGRLLGRTRGALSRPDSYLWRLAPMLEVPAAGRLRMSAWSGSSRRTARSPMARASPNHSSACRSSLLSQRRSPTRHWLSRSWPARIRATRIQPIVAIDCREIEGLRIAFSPRLGLDVAVDDVVANGLASAVEFAARDRSRDCALRPGLACRRDRRGSHAASARRPRYPLRRCLSKRSRCLR